MFSSFLSIFSRPNAVPAESVKPPEPPKLSEFPQFHGTFRGFAPSDESPNSLGELEVVITASTIRLSHATGLKVDITEYPIAQFTRLAPDPIAASSAESDQVVFQLGESRIQYVFGSIVEGNDAPGLSIRGAIGDLIGPTMAFGPKLIQDGIWQTALDELEAQGMPMLKYNGKVPPQYIEQQEKTTSMSM